MPFKFLLYGNVHHREQWLSQNEPEETRKAYIAATVEFIKELKIVAGEANGKLFDRKEFADAIESVFIEKPEANFKLVFHKKDTKDEAREAFQTENLHFFTLKQKYPERVHIYWTPKRPHQHYAVIDNAVVILEKPHHTPYEPFWATIIRDSEVSSQWENHFDTYVNQLEEITF